MSIWTKKHFYFLLFMLKGKKSRQINKPELYSIVKYLWNITLKADIGTVRLWCDMDSDVITLYKENSYINRQILTTVLVQFNSYFPKPKYQFQHTMAIIGNL